jgi:hypothetical protein
MTRVVKSRQSHGFECPVGHTTGEQAWGQSHIKSNSHGLSLAWVNPSPQGVTSRKIDDTIWGYHIHHQEITIKYFIIIIIFNIILI